MACLSPTSGLAKASIIARAGSSSVFSPWEVTFGHCSLWFKGGCHRQGKLRWYPVAKRGCAAGRQMLLSFAPLRQARGALATAAIEGGESDEYSDGILLGRVDSLAQPPAPPDFLQVFHPPLDYAFVTSSDAATYSGWGASYRRMVALRKEAVDLTGFDSWMAIEERWARSIDEAFGWTAAHSSGSPTRSANTLDAGRLA